MLDPRFMSLLRCPCGGALHEQNDALDCASCGARHPIVRGITRFTGSGDDGQAQVADAFGYKWTRGSEFGMSGETKAATDAWILELRGWRDEAELASHLAPFKTILDAGAGQGRDVMQIARLRPDALIIGIDVSRAIDVAAEHAKSLPNVFLIQGDISHPPLKPASFDHISSNGVLHHTPSTRGAVEALYPLLKEGGEFTFMIYAKKAPIREFTDDYVRGKLRTMTPSEAWSEMESITLLGKALSELNVDIEIPEVKLLGMKAGRHDIQRLLYYTVLKCYWRDTWSFEDNVHVNYDWYYPEYAWRHTPEEVRSWIVDLGAEEIFFKQVPAQLSFRLRKPRMPLAENL